MDRMTLLSQLFDANQRMKVLNDELKTLQEEICFLEVEDKRSPVNIQQTSFFRNQIFLVGKRIENQSSLIKRIRFALKKGELDHQLKVSLEQITLDCKEIRQRHTQEIVADLQKTFPRNN